MLQDANSVRIAGIVVRPPNMSLYKRVVIAIKIVHAHTYLNQCKFELSCIQSKRLYLDCRVEIVWKIWKRNKRFVKEYVVLGDMWVSLHCGLHFHLSIATGSGVFVSYSCPASRWLRFVCKTVIDFYLFWVFFTTITDDFVFITFLGRPFIVRVFGF